MKKAPWCDHKGNELYERDKIKHKSNETGMIIFLNNYTHPSDQWRVDYGNGYFQGGRKLCIPLSLQLTICGMGLTSVFK